MPCRKAVGVWAGRALVVGLVPYRMVTLADVVQRLRFSRGNVRGSSVGFLHDENLAGSVGDAECLHQSLEAREWSGVRCCGLDDAFRHGIWYAQRWSQFRFSWTW